MVTISKDTFQKAFLLSIIGHFSESVYGRLRMHKVAFFAESSLEESPLKPFQYKYYYYGQYSDQMEKTMEELENVGAIDIRKITQAHYLDIPSEKKKIRDLAKKTVEGVDPIILSKIQEAVEKYGYLPEKELLDEAYNHSLMQGKDWGDLLIEENLPSRVEIDMDQETVEDLELLLDPRFTIPLRELSKGLKTVELSSKTEDFLLNASRQ